MRTSRYDEAQPTGAVARREGMGAAETAERARTATEAKASILQKGSGEREGGGGGRGWD